MTRHELARIVDPDALGAAAGSRARLRIQVPEAWLAAGRRVTITVPTLLTCDRCDGGGCDACQRSGALRVARPSARRPLELRLPAEPRGAVMRLVRPLPESDLEQLLIEIRPAERASAGVALCRRRPGLVPSPLGAPRVSGKALATAALIAMAALLALLLWHW